MGASAVNLIRCNREQRLQLVATGSTTPEALERLQAAAVAGWERFVVPPAARRGSSSRIDPAFCLLWQLYAGLLSVRPPPSSCRFDPSVAILHSSLPGRSHLTEHRWSRTETAIHSLHWPLLQCQCPVTAVSPRSATQTVMPRYRFLLPVPPCVDALQASVN